MNKKVTVKDVAREAGVSVATVSYIMNDRKDQKISEETRKKVLQIANLMNYRPSHAAKTLATGKTNLVGITYSLASTSLSRNREITNFALLLMQQLNEQGYNVLFIPDSASVSNLPLNGNIDGIIAIDLPDKRFRELADHYLVPVICVDMCVDDPLFYQIYTDYTTRLKKARECMGDDAYLVMDSFANEGYHARICLDQPQDRILHPQDCNSDILTRLQASKVIIIGNYLAMMLRPYLRPENMYVISSETSGLLAEKAITYDVVELSHKADCCVRVLLSAIERNFVEEHDFPQ